MIVFIILFLWLAIHARKRHKTRRKAIVIQQTPPPVMYTKHAITAARPDVAALIKQRDTIKAEIKRLESETDDCETDAEKDLNAEIMRLEKEIKAAQGLKKTRLENELAALQVEIFCKDKASKPQSKSKAVSDPGKQINKIISLYGKLAAVESKLNKAQSRV